MNAKMPGLVPHTRCLIALELGGNLGHLTHGLALARQLRSDGAEVSFAVPDLQSAASMLGAEGFAYVQSPIIRPPRRKRLAAPVNFADLLLQQGYGEPGALHGSVQAWCRLFALLRVDVVITDFAPAALLAAHAAGIRAVATGSGFFIPPDQRPWPSLRPWENIAAERLQAADDALLGRINQALRAAKCDVMVAPQELFTRAQCCIASYPELDHYGPRAEWLYAGHYYSNSRGQYVDWPSPTNADPSPKRIFAYLRPELPGFGPMLQALQECGYLVILAAPGLPALNAKRFSTPRLRCVDAPVAIKPLLPTIDLVVSYGSIGLVTETLLAGIPQLMLPPFAEQALFAWRVEQLGAGISMAQQADAARCAGAVEAMLSGSTYKDAAAAFAVRSHRPDAEAALRSLARKTVALHEVVA